MAIALRLAEDKEASIRSELMEQIPHIAILCHERKEQLYFVVLEHLLPMVLNLLSDENSQVRKTALAALLVLMEQGLLELAAVEETVCPVILKLTELDCAEFQTGAIAFMGKMAPIMGKSATERLFLTRFVSLCTDPVFYVRRVCANTFGQFCSVVGKAAIECILLPRFLELCEDQMWAVRKACAEVFMSLSCACTLAMRKEYLAPLFANLLSDPAQWVQLAAYQTLGPFISTFADPSVIGLSYNKLGELELSNPEGEEFKSILERIQTSEVSDSEILRIIAESKPYSNSALQDGSTELMYNHVGEASKSSNQSSVIYKACDTEAEEASNTESSPEAGERQRTVGSVQVPVMDGGGNANSQLRVRESDGQVHIHVESFNTFQYWRLPIPELELDISLAEGGIPTSVHVKAKVPHEQTQRTYSSELQVNMDMDLDTELNELASRLEQCSFGDKKKCVAKVCTESVATVSHPDTTMMLGSSVQKAVAQLRPNGDRGDVNPSHYKLLSMKYKTNVQEGDDPNPDRDGWAPQGDFTLAALPDLPTQDIVPQVLVHYFVSMAHSPQKTEPNIAHFCAFSFPAVALTLGRSNWPLLKGSYEALASNMQWKVRKTVAASIHELAMILGEDLANKDLVPIFRGFIKDLDEVRIGALKHLADFLKLLRPAERNSFLPRLSEFLLTDNDWNWRFRLELAEQLLMATSLFSPDDTRKYLSPVAVSLLLDRVAEVRRRALRLVTRVVARVGDEALLVRGLLTELAETFAHSRAWNQRQAFAFLCSQMVIDRALPESCFAQDVLPNLLDLSWDPVPNVRLAVAHTLSCDILPQPFFSSDKSPHHEVLIQVIKRLHNDSDRDVRECSVPPRSLQVFRGIVS